MTSYCSLAYLFFFLPGVMLLYSVTPKKYRWISLLAANYIFFWCFSGKLLAFLLFSTLSIHHFGIWLSKLQDESMIQCTGIEKENKKAVKAEFQRKQTRVILLAAFIHVGILVILKYTSFFGTNLNTLLAKCGFGYQFTIPRFVLPLGISFYTMQALSYLFDVYRGKLKADENLGRLALYLSFFPQIMEGSICRYSDTAEQLWQGERIAYRNLTFGIQRILFGLLKKIVVADRLNLLIKTVFSDYGKYDGGVIAVAMICYTCQLYMEFSGTMDVVIGSGEIFGIRMPENFRQPFFSKSISDFWTRWHITLGAWFRDYIFYPLSMSRLLKKLTLSARKRLGNHFGPLIAGTVALFCVWFCNGLWHGAAWNYIFFGMYHFTLILIGNIFEPVIQWIAKIIHIDRNCWPYRILQIMRTVILVNIGELFFRANGLRAGLAMFKKMICNFTFDSVRTQTVFKIGMDKHDFLIVAITVFIVFIISLLKENKVEVRCELSKRNTVIRWAVYLVMILYIVIFGAYGIGYVPIDPIYANF